MHDVKLSNRRLPFPLLVVLVAVPVCVFLFFMFEVWFTIPLPKGPLEAMFGY